MHAGCLESTREMSELLEAQPNTLQTSQVNHGGNAQLKTEVIAICVKNRSHDCVAALLCKVD